MSHNENHAAKDVATNNSGSKAYPKYVAPKKTKIAAPTQPPPRKACASCTRTDCPHAKCTTIPYKVEEPPAVRYVKLQATQRASSTLINGHDYKVVPELYISGNWLQAAGFQPYKYATIVVMNNMLIIKPAQEVKPQRK